MPGFNGHKNWNHWNVSLWINNDENLYAMARKYARIYHRKKAALEMLRELHSIRINHTPDGAPYSVTTIMAAIREI